MFSSSAKGYGNLWLLSKKWTGLEVPSRKMDIILNFISFIFFVWLLEGRWNTPHGIPYTTCVFFIPKDDMYDGYLFFQHQWDYFMASSLWNSFHTGWQLMLYNYMADQLDNWTLAYALILWWSDQWTNDLLEFPQYW